MCGNRDAWSNRDAWPNRDAWWNRDARSNRDAWSNRASWSNRDAWWNRDAWSNRDAPPKKLTLQLLSLQIQLRFLPTKLLLLVGVDHLVGLLTKSSLIHPSDEQTRVQTNGE